MMPTGEYLYLVDYNWIDYKAASIKCVKEELRKYIHDIGLVKIYDKAV